jgi:N-acetylneuraminate synthase
MAKVNINNRFVGDGYPVYVIAEIGINHNGSLEITKRLIDEAIKCGCDAVKFQKRTPDLCVPEDQKLNLRETPWGRMTYLDYKKQIEFEEEEYTQIDAYCRERKLTWFASCWDLPSVDFMEQFNPPVYKAASASLTDHDLLRKMKATGRPLIISTGMSTQEEIESAVESVGRDNLLIAHSTSAYPCEIDELNLRMIKTLKDLYSDNPIGYSGHETGLATTVATVAMGATFIERHFTLNRAMWGTDQAASVEPEGMRRMVRDIRHIERAMGDGVKKVYDSELPILSKLRKVGSPIKVI